MMDWLVEQLADHPFLAMGSVVCVTVGLLAGLVWADYEAHKNQICVQSHQQWGFIQSGNVMVPYQYTVCDQWVPKPSPVPPGK